MIKKIISLFTLTAIVVFTFSCYATKRETIKTITSWQAKGKDVKIVTVLKKSGERIEFPKDEPGKMVGDKIVGDAVDDAIGRKPVSIPIPDVWVVWVMKADTGKTVAEVLGGTALTMGGLALILTIYVLMRLIKRPI